MSLVLDLAQPYSIDAGSKMKMKSSIIDVLSCEEQNKPLVCISLASHHSKPLIGNKLMQLLEDRLGNL